MLWFSSKVKKLNKIVHRLESIQRALQVHEFKLNEFKTHEFDDEISSLTLNEIDIPHVLPVSISPTVCKVNNSPKDDFLEAFRELDRATSNARDFLQQRRNS